MTVIGAIPDGQGGFYMGSDSLSVVSGNRCSTKEQKIFVRPDGWAVGVSGTGKFMDLLRDHWDTIDVSSGQSVVDGLRSVLKGDDWEFGVREGAPKWVDLNLVLCGGGKLWAIYTDLCLALHDPNLTPGVFVGSGAEVAIGAAICGARAGDPPETVLRRALEAACQIDIHCGGEIVVHHLPKREAPNV